MVLVKSIFPKQSSQLDIWVKIRNKIIDRFNFSQNIQVNLYKTMFTFSVIPCGYFSKIICILFKKVWRAKHLASWFVSSKSLLLLHASRDVSSVGNVFFIKLWANDRYTSQSCSWKLGAIFSNRLFKALKLSSIRRINEWLMMQFS